MTQLDKIVLAACGLATISCLLSVWMILYILQVV